ncbi:hypothetical protein DBR06_SOUSAS3810132, partial [Sousa chinensis]
QQQAVWLESLVETDDNAVPLGSP